MNTDKIKGAAKDAAGSVERAVGKATNSPSTVAKGDAKKIAGKAQKAVGAAKDALK